MAARKASLSRNSWMVPASTRARTTREVLWNRTTLFGEMSISTPGRMTILTLVIIAIILVGGIYSAQTISNRQQHFQTLLAEVEPVANASQSLYSALSIADSAANTAFIAGGLEPQEVRDTYSQSITDAAAAIVAATRGVDPSDRVSIENLAEINASLPIYAGLVETARANNRVGNPVGSAYLAEASALMQDRILPSAADLFDRQSDHVVYANERWSTPPWWSFAALGLALAALLLAQLWLQRRTARILNIGLVISSFLVIAALLWTMISGFLTAANNERGLEEGAAPMNELTRARIAAQQVRAQETLALVRRADPERLTAERSIRMADIRRALTIYVRDEDAVIADQGSVTKSIEALDSWEATQRLSDSLYQQGDYSGAITIASGQGTNHSGAAFKRLDSALQDSINSARSRLRDRIDSARRTSSTAPAGIVTLCALASLAAIGGIAPRIREYL